MLQQSTVHRTVPPRTDERVRSISALEQLLRRPELGSLGGAILVFVIFAAVADPHMFSALGVVNWLTVSAQLGVVAAGACLLMIAGEFDLSVGSMIAFVGMVMVLLLRYSQLPPWMAILVGFAVALTIGYSIGQLVVRTRLPSFIVSLAFLFVLRGATLVAARMVTGSTQVGGAGDAKESDFLAWLFGGKAFGFVFEWLVSAGLVERLKNGAPAIAGLPMIVLWCLAIGLSCAFVLSSTRFGNWIFAVGGDANAARSSGIPVNKVKVRLFVFSAFCAAVFAAAQVFDFGSADGNRGLLKEFEAIIAAVIGGTLLTGGYGSVIGALLGSLIFGVVSTGFFYTGVDGDWFRVFLGAVLLGAVMFNNYVRRRVTGGL
jgi:simple sugar transport system permease protein